jgi:hypothetical protein
MLDLYVDALWNLDAGTRMMMVKLPRMADEISNQELATVLRDTLGQASHAEAQLTVMVSHFAGPARVHAVEMESLLGDTARRLADWAPGDPRDLYLNTVVRSVIHTAIPECELAIALAEVVGFPQHLGELKVFRSQMQASDESLRRMSDQQIRATSRPRGKKG